MYDGVEGEVRCDKQRVRKVAQRWTRLTVHLGGLLATCEERVDQGRETELGRAGEKAEVGNRGHGAWGRVQARIDRDGERDKSG